MTINNISKIVATILLFTTSADATLNADKATLKGNMVVKYTKYPSSVDNISDAFLDGVFYGRLRANTFRWDWKKDNYPNDPKSKLMDNKAMGIGGSFIYKTAPISGVSATIGLYSSQNSSLYREDSTDAGYVKSGKDTFSRFNAYSTGNYGMSVLGVAYLRYDIGKTTLIAGRQMFESVFTKSNDTKMIPNTFDGITATINDIAKTSIQLAYLDKQKLRDHTKAHDVIAFAGGSSPQKYSQNDDAGVNKNLTVDKIGDSNSLIIATVTNKSIKNLKANLSYASVGDVLSNLTFEMHYAIPIMGNFKVIPGLRYMQQFDNLGANYDVANLSSKHDGYKQDAKQSLDSSLLAIRLDVKNKAFLARFGYSQIADKADIVAPWRGFPTGGFTRAMAQYNWFANTKTYMLRAGYDFGKANILEGFSIMARYAIQDFDDKKLGVGADSTVIHIDARQNIGKNLELKVRLGFVDAKDDITLIKDDGSSFTKLDTSYNEYRVELNYFF